MSAAARTGEPVSHVLSQDAIDRYAELSGDYNPIHVDAEHAARTEFGGRIAHGPLVLGVFFDALSRALGTDSLPPETALEASFRRPTPAGATVTCVWGEIALDDDLARLRAKCVTDAGVTAVEVTATVPAPAGSAARSALLGEAQNSSQ